MMASPQTTNNCHYAVFIGRFQPLHIGHLYVFEQALKQAEKLIILVGSSGGVRTLRNPFTFAERAAMIQAALPPALRKRVIVKPLQDFTYNNAAWVAAVNDTVAAILTTPAQTVALVGHDKDETTFYLKFFPNWAYIEVDNLNSISATTVRQRYFTEHLPAQFNSEVLPPPTVAWLREFGCTQDFSALANEYNAIAAFQSAWANTPYPVIFTTTDALVRHGDELLLIRRKNHPGKGLLALPGGFLQQNETLFNGCLRELIEETQLDVDTTTLTQSVVSHNVFDNPTRSTRGRVITYCYYFDLSHLPEKPTVQAADDAAAAMWANRHHLKRADFFEDHFFIIQSLLQEKNHD